MVVLSVAVVSRGGPEKIVEPSYIRTYSHIHIHTYIHTECFTSPSGSSHFCVPVYQKNELHL